MGVPKFFRYISERYPCLSELVKEYQIPEFDNLYLDMNGIIHVCSHPDDTNPHFRITEEKIFQDVFHYIEVLFRMIKPRKIFFMAVDGVAPRAKMNQQRSRRFRSAKDAERAEAKAKEQGENLPDQARFDSNCITPGTVFMTKLHEQLKYFVVNKISSDPLWQKCKIIFSGHETPGEGEHKIMDYIRYTRSQPGYDPNTRHCLYGLDADLIMLGLCSHEPHFSLLREEVRFGSKSTKRKNIPEQISFFLLHLSLMREYLELEFAPVRENLPFDFDIEKLIDDWVLMGFLVGNDFIPNLPNLHISNGALPILYTAYMKVLPTLDGYINEAGTLHLTRFQKFMDNLSRVDLDNFNDTYADLKYFESKTGRSLYGGNESCSRNMAKNQLKSFSETGNIDTESCSSTSSHDEMDDDLFIEEFELHKRSYYIEKLEYEQVTPEIMKSQAEGYVRAIQWNLHYYYNGVCSWSWYYPHHYAPYISDIKNFSELDLKFDLGKPFKPYEQLLAVLPPASKELLPKCYHPLMTDESSVLKNYFPDDFQTDLNGKRQEWEAVVLVPFIDEQMLLDAMEPCNKLLTLEEIKRNQHGPMIVYKYTDENHGEYKAPDYFHPVKENHAEYELVYIDDIKVEPEKLVKGAYPGVKLDVYYPGFPTMKHLKYTGVLEKAKVKVFEQPSNSYNMLLILEHSNNKPIEKLAIELLNQIIFVSWPHLVEAKVVSVSNSNYRYHATSGVEEYNIEMNKGNLQQLWHTEVNASTENYKNRLGIVVGNTEILVHVKVMTGRKYIFSQQGRITYEKQWSDITYSYPLQTIVKNIATYNEAEVPYKDIESLFSVGSFCFMLGHPHYGSMGKVLDSKESIKKGRLKVEMRVYQDPNFDAVYALEKDIKIRYMSLYDAAIKLGISKYLFSRITGTIFVVPDYCKNIKSSSGTKFNIGLNLKFNKRNEEIPGYTKKIGTTWFYSEKVIELMKSYMENYPELFDYLNNNNSNTDDYYYSEIFPCENPEEKVTEITNWIKNQEYVKIEKQSCGMCALEPAVVKKLESIVDEFVQNGPQGKLVTMQIKPFLLYSANIQSSTLAPDSNAVYKIYDRVVNIRPSYTVPVGYIGTIIAIHKTAESNKNDIMYDVVFDQPFAGGLDLNCSPNRGYRLPRAALINKSYGQRQFEEKTGKLEKVQTPVVQRTNLQGVPLYMPPKQVLPQQQKYPNSAFVSCWANRQDQRQNEIQNMPPKWNYVQPNTSEFLKKFPPQQFNHPQNMPLRPAHNCFMPSFNNKPNQENAGTSTNAGKVDTDLLKKMLGINVSATSETRENGSAASNSVEKFFSNAKVPIKTDKNSQSQQKLYSIQLREYYQRKGHGIPQYCYFPHPNNQFTCQVITVDGQMLTGDPKNNKEDACENLAEKYYNLLQPKNSPVVNIKLPVPPKQWCQQESKPSEKHKKNHKNNKLEEATILTTKQNAHSSIPFVPLQAVRQQKNKSAHQINKVNPNKAISGQQNNRNEGNKKEQMDNENPSANEHNNGKNKPKRERKIRIAANFSKSMQN